ncbi:Universal stress protein UspA [Planctomycetales bacterium 10988]|nr:Universal stress protein UspA [Planctomycetales bacterium 10988]
MIWLPKKTVVVPVDFSKESFRLLNLAADEFVNDIKELHAIHVLPKLSAAEPGVIWKTVTDQSRKEHAAVALKKCLDNDEKFEGLNIEIAIGDPGRKVIDYCKGIEADLILMGYSKPNDGIRMSAGTVVDRIVRVSHCPVLVFPPETV